MIASGRPKISVIAPANTMADLGPDLRDHGIQNLERLGFEVMFERHVDRRHHHTAGTVQDRVEDLHRAFRDESVHVVMPVFGGYNSNQLLPHLDYELIKARRKPLVGRSDTTALLIGIARCAGSPVIHGPSFSTFCDPDVFDETCTGLTDVLANRPQVLSAPRRIADDAWYKLPGYGPREVRRFAGWTIYRPGISTGKLVGGNLETLTSLIGTPYFLPPNGHLLFLEDSTGASPGAFHRDLCQLAQAGILDHVAGLMIGTMPHGSRLDDPAVLAYILDDVAGAYQFPIVTNVNCSHSDPVLSLPIDVRATLEAVDVPRLVVDPIGLV